MSVRPINKDVLSLNKKAELATPADMQIVTDLVDTLQAHLDGCVGMAANMIGVNKRIIVFAMGTIVVPMINPKILKKNGSYETEEGCLSLSGKRKTIRYQQIEVEYQDCNFKKMRQTFSGHIAQIIQHEIDHCEGIVI